MRAVNRYFCTCCASFCIPRLSSNASCSSRLSSARSTRAARSLALCLNWVKSAKTPACNPLSAACKRMAWACMLSLSASTSAISWRICCKTTGRESEISQKTTPLNRSSRERHWEAASASSREENSYIFCSRCNRCVCSGLARANKKSASGTTAWDLSASSAASC